MGTILHFKSLYLNAFTNCKPLALVLLLKVYSVFCAAMILLAFYVFFYKAFTGFDF
ncbi:DUF6747 family protein [Aurantibacter crassamenti]|uniref:DUF6747 family protein n=1 Tax=Aurantibacter crassamenti TaxID=1837375 RepID=UPI00293D714E|nr:DUF6747 family protein [Aurantibacter crassamenti]